jgi:hypothetical protein
MKFLFIASSNLRIFIATKQLPAPGKNAIRTRSPQAPKILDNQIGIG